MARFAAALSPGNIRASDPGHLAGFFGNGPQLGKHCGIKERKEKKSNNRIGAADAAGFDLSLRSPSASLATVGRGVSRMKDVLINVTRPGDEAPLH